MKSWLPYTLIRLVAFAAGFAAVYLVRPDLWLLAVVVGAVVSLCVSYLFLGRYRRGMVEDLQHRQERPVRVDDTAEDAEVEASTNAPTDEPSPAHGATRA